MVLGLSEDKKTFKTSSPPNTGFHTFLKEKLDDDHHYENEIDKKFDEDRMNFVIKLRLTK